MKAALVELKEARAELDALKRARSEPIAIVGMGCRFPGGADSLDAYWRLLSEGVDAISEVPADRWDQSAFYDPDPDVPGKMSTRFGGFLERIDEFDCDFFRISPREAKRLDPQQRLLLEVSWEALEDAGQAPDQLYGSATGVFVGLSTFDYALHQVGGAVERGDLDGLDGYVATGATMSPAAGRLSYVLGLNGPSMVVDTACSSSLVATHLGVASLRNGECDLALVGGANVILRPEWNVNFTKARMLAADGRCKTFDAAADGYTRGEGCGIVVLKRLSDALQHDDRIYAVVRGSALNQDGASGGLTVPNGPSQERVIRRALDAAGVTADSVSYVEAHGTGTSLGDPIEVSALGAVFGRDRPASRTLLIGSVKTAIGHLEAAAGVAGLIKVALSLSRREIPPHLHFECPNPLIDWATLPVAVPVESTAWPAVAPLRAGISSFGFAGTNAHVVLEEAPPQPESNSDADAADASRRGFHLLPLSARSEPALEQLVARYARHLRAHPDLSMSDVAFTASSGRSHFRHRLALVVSSSGDAREKIDTIASGGVHADAIRGRTQDSTRVAFLFSGQGSQYVGMGRELYQSNRTFRDAMDRCAEILAPYLEQPLLDVIHAPAGETSPLDETAFTQPALFALEYALVTLWRSWGIEPHAVMGHSVGEYVAACVAGSMSLEQGLKLIAQRARLMQNLQRPGRMAVVFAEEALVGEAIAAYADELSIAAINGPENCVIAGAADAIAAVVDEFESRGIATRTLPVSHAFHSSLMEPMLEEFRAIAGQIRFASPTIPLVSNLTGEPAGPETLTSTYWARHAREPVRFASGMRALRDSGCDVFIEIGPKTSLLSTGRTCVPDADCLWLPSLRPEGDWNQILHSLGQLYVRGVPIDWDGLHRTSRPRRVALPTYPFQRQRHWVDREYPRSGLREVTATPPPEKRQRVTRQRAGEALYELVWREAAHPARDDSTASGARWIVFEGRCRRGSVLAQKLAAAGDQCIIVVPGERFRKIAADAYEINPADSADYRQLLEAVAAEGVSIRGIVHLGSLDAAGASGPMAEQLAAGSTSESALLLAQALIGSTLADTPRLWLVTAGGVAAGRNAESTPLSIAQAIVWGLGRVFALEHPDSWGGIVDLSPAGDADADIDALARELQSPTEEDQIAYRAGTRYVPRLVKRIDEMPVANPSFRPDGSFLITGGLGALGLHAARWLVSRGARHLTLVSRRGADAPGAAGAVEELQALGCQVTIASADVSRPEELRQLLAGIAAGATPLRGVVHAAGIETRAPISDMTLAQWRSILAPKALGGCLLDAASRDAGVELFLCFSSISSLLGFAERAHYAAANAALDVIVHERRRAGFAALSVNWGPWKGGGMGTDRELEQLEQMGNRGLEPDIAVAALDILAAGSCGQASVIDMDWPRFRSLFEARRPRPLLAEIGQVPHEALSPDAGSAPAPWWSRLQNTPEHEREELLGKLLRQEIATTLRISDSEQVAMDTSVFDMGMDSLMAVEVTTRLNRHLDFDTSTLLFEHPRIDELASRLVERLPRDAPSAVDGKAPATGTQPACARPTTDEPAVADDPGTTLPRPDEIESFSRIAWPLRQERWLRRRWHWRFIESAQRVGTAPGVWIHREGGEIVAHHGAVPVRLQVGNEELTTAWFVDTMVLESHRAAAIGARLIMQAKQQLPFGLSLGQTATIRDMAFRLGWQRVAPLRSYVFPLRPQQVLRHKLPPALAAFTGAALNVRQQIKKASSRATTAGLEGRIIDQFGAAHDQLWNSVRRDYECAVVRNAAYLNWKFVAQPGRDFVRMEFVRDSAIVAVAVLSVYDPCTAYPYRRAIIVELLVSSRDTGLVLSVLESIRQRCVGFEVDSIVFDLINDRLEHALKVYGFLEREPSRYLLVSPDGLSDRQRSLVLSSTSWLITRGDSDLDSLEVNQGFDEVPCPGVSSVAP
jgi:acyl transferase domain-containing protein